MSEQSLKRLTVAGVKWRLLETGCTQFIQLLISIVLARYIVPAQFAPIAMIAVFLAVAQTFIDSGFPIALIRKNDRTQIDCDTVFYFNIAISMLCYGLLFLISPWVAEFYDIKEITSILRVAALSIIIGSMAGVHKTLFEAQMNFGILARINLIAIVLSGILGIYLAHRNFQVWALVWQSIVAASCRTLLTWFYSAWRPSLHFSFISLRVFFSFGSKLLASSLIDTVFTNLYSVVIGKFFAPAKLAFFNRASSLKDLTSAAPTGILQSVTFPALCKFQDDDVALRQAYRRIIRVSAFLIFPLCLGVGAVAYPLINLLFTKIWIKAAGMLSILVYAGMWYPIHALNLNLLQVKGRSDLFLRLEIIKKALCIVMLCITVPLGIEAICYGMIFNSVIALVINTFYTGKLLNLSLLTQCRDLLPSLLLSIGMYILCKWLCTMLGLGFISLSISILAGIAFYLGGALIFRFPELGELKSLK